MTRNTRNLIAIASSLTLLLLPPRPASATDQQPCIDECVHQYLVCKYDEGKDESFCHALLESCVRIMCGLS